MGYTYIDRTVYIVQKAIEVAKRGKNPSDTSVYANKHTKRNPYSRASEGIYLHNGYKDYYVYWRMQIFLFYVFE